ncbi:hypothetical protein CFP71_14740 [Amycolatopsis thailandensis]|uniref:Uncharacterized protein n=1 Tax=Amycolatopsis thailandensis TaxID=589330 RepID=A0A229SB02_9PSEU|nr:hypothetical protein CFP71_14740 [Amycolatopsis thailandensis]
MRSTSGRYFMQAVFSSRKCTLLARLCLASNIFTLLKFQCGMDSGVTTARKFPMVSSVSFVLFSAKNAQSTKAGFVLT